MRVEKTESGAFRATFWLFGYELQRDFSTEKDALVFFENLKSNYITDLSTIEFCVQKYLGEVSSLKSKDSYDLDHRLFSRFCVYLIKNHIMPTDPITKINLGHIEGFQAWLQTEKGLGAASVNRYFNTLKHFFGKCERWGLIRKNPSKFVASLYVKRPEKEIWSEVDFQAVYDVMNEADRKILLFLRLTGSRISSATELHWSDVDFEHNELRLISRKGGSNRLSFYAFPLHDKLKKFLKDLKEKKVSEYVFLTTSGHPYAPPRVSRKVTKALRNPLVQSKTKGKHLSAHGLRHTFATEMLEKGLSINDVKMLLGHSTVKVTEQYLHSDTEKLTEKLNKIA